jgi:hypothetical protein
MQHNLRALTDDPRYWRFMALDESARELEEDRDLMYIRAEQVQQQEASFFSQRSSDEQHLRVCRERAKHLQSMLSDASFTLTGVAPRTPRATELQIHATWSATTLSTDGAATLIAPPVESSRLRGLIARDVLGRFSVRVRPRDDQTFRALRIEGLVS